MTDPFAPTRYRRAGLLLIGAFVALIAVVVAAATSPLTEASVEAAAELGLDTYVNGSLPLDTLAALMREHAGGPLDFTITVASVLVWLLFAAAVWAATGLRTPPAPLSAVARAASIAAVLAWAAMLILDQVLATRGSSFGSYYPLWFAAEGLLGATVGIAVVAMSVTLSGSVIGRTFGVVLVVLSGVLAIASVVLPFLGAAAPPIIGPFLGAVLGIGLLASAGQRRIIRESSPTAGAPR